ncbi:unnamed protein product [Gongylonema pulchrum]|uniref:Sulfotransfer_1 domain-containing protein n=1 Tax=Gongylonema pulchrum TaxID=637853 RepID=A0A183EG76_9BILA|nr:unnamed protein product [Gongylonema pulchrum]
MNSSMKLILILRDPVTRTISDFTQVTVEKTPAYFTNHYAAQRVHRMNSSMKLILILRDPVTRTISDFTQLRKVESFLRIPESFEADQFVFNKHKGFFCFRQKDRRIAKCLGNTKGRAHVDISPESILKLRENFRAYNEKFFRMVNQWWNWWDKPLL